MRYIFMMLLAMQLLTACNFKEGLKETGDAVQQGVQNAGEAAKQLPADVSEASNKAEQKIRN